MAEETDDKCPRSETNDHAKGDAVKKHRRRIFYGSFWSDHPVSVVGLLLSAILLSPITSFPGGQPKDFWFVVSGVAVFLCVIAFWFIDGLLNLNTPTEEELQQEHRERVDSALGRLDSRVGLVEQRTSQRALSAKTTEAITKALSGFAGQRVKIQCLLGDAEGVTFVQGLIDALARAGWAMNGSIAMSAYPTNFRNFRLGVSPEHVSSEHGNGGLLPPAKALLEVLFLEGVTDDRSVYWIQQSLKGTDICIMVAPRQIEA
jgi:hypothetical protein